MLILYGIRHKMEKEVWAGVDTCQVCGVNRDRFLARRRTAFTLFYIPVIWFNTGRYLISCEACQTGGKIKKKAYNKARDTMMAAYKGGEFPVRVVDAQYNKKQLGITGKVLRVILAWVIFLVAGFFMLTNGAAAILSIMNGYTDIGSIVFALIAAAIGIPQLFTSHARLSRAKKMLRIAKKYEGKVDAAPVPAVEETAPAAAIEESAPAAEESAPAAEEAAPAAEEAAPAVEEAAPAAEEAALTAEEAAPAAEEAAPAAEEAALTAEEAAPAAE